MGTHGSSERAAVVVDGRDLIALVAFAEERQVCLACLIPVVFAAGLEILLSETEKELAGEIVKTAEAHHAAYLGKRGVN